MGYLGAKGGSGVYQAIINLMPPHDTYIEPFLGTGTVMLKKPPALKNIGIDLDNEMIVKFSKEIQSLGNINETTLMSVDSIEWLKSFKPTDRTLIYCDPPYLASTRTSSNRYKHEMTDNDHKRLLNVLIKSKSFILLSGYKNAIYQKLLKDWYSLDFQAMTRGGVRTETVWCNFSPGQIHYHKYAGRNYTDRQRIQRKATRWANKYEALPPGEKQAILAAILATETT